MTHKALASLVVLAACEPTRLAPQGADADLEQGCSPGTSCAPYEVDGFPWTHHGDTRTEGEDRVDSYACASSTTEGGHEVWFAVDVPSSGRLTVSHPEVSGDGVDVDVHILTDLDPDSCLARGDASASASVQPGTVYVVVDTWSGRDGTAYAGTYDLTIDLQLMPTGTCAVKTDPVKMRWSSCSSAVPDCYTSGGSRYLSMPTSGDVVKEAHLVTEEDPFSGWPSSSRSHISEHYATTEAVTGYRMNRTESWAPSGEGGSRYGQGATSVRIPAEAEAWYVNMNWSSRPAPGTPMIVRNPSNGRAVVAAAGYETGPSANDAVAGVSEEVHDWLGTSHLSELEIGFAVDPSLPFGPIDCGGSQGGSQGGGSSSGGSGGGTSGGSSGGGATTEACYLGSDRSGDTCLALVTLPAGTSGYAYPSSADARYAPPVRYLDLRDWTGSERLAPNFTLSELAVEDDGRWAVVQPGAVAHLQAMRDRLGGLNVNSGYRNVSHNAAVGGATLSRHMWGDAFDLDPSAASLSAMASACRDEGAGYVESYTTHVHCDWRDDALDPVFFGGARSAARMPDDSMVAWLDWRGRALTAPATGFDEGEPLRTWSAWDADGHLLAEVAAETFEPPEGAVTVGVDVGSRLWLELDL